MTIHTDLVRQLHLSTGTADKNDIPTILAIQNANLVQNLSPAERQQYGFIGIETPADLLSQIVADETIPVLRAKEEVVGYFIPASIEQSQQLPLLRPLLSKLPSLTFGSQKLADLAICIGVQAVISRPFTGQGLSTLLYSELKRALGKRYYLVVSEICVQNSRSTHVHLNKIGWKAIEAYRRDDVPEEGRDWLIAAFKMT